VWDEWSSTAVCGLALVRLGADHEWPDNVHNGLPTLGAYTTPSNPALGLDPYYFPKYSMTFRGVSIRGARPVDCFKKNLAAYMTHEIMHTLGAVQLSAPHSDGGSHCTDKPSVLCLGKGAARCVAASEILDCGQDDYWNPSPAPGSYLDTHWNIAESQFFGPQPQDRLVGAPL
jgi:hypothetical protein